MAVLCHPHAVGPWLSASLKELGTGPVRQGCVCLREGLGAWTLGALNRTCVESLGVAPPSGL